MENNVITRGDYIEWLKANPLHLDKPLCKKPKYLDKVWVGFTRGEAHEAWVLALTGGDFGTNLKQQEYGDMIQVFFPPKHGETFYRGVKEFWLMDIGIGKTKEECIKTFCKYKWFRRSIDNINHDRFWASIKKK
jgi:hypothetical protein